jgi:hypothetical protein
MENTKKAQHCENDSTTIEKFQYSTGVECRKPDCDGMLTVKDDFEVGDEAVVALCSACHGYYELGVEYTVDYFDPRPLSEDEV